MRHCNTEKLLTVPLKQFTKIKRVVQLMKLLEEDFGSFVSEWNFKT
jgi:hypothetical protein